MFRILYWLFSHLGLMTVSAFFIIGFKQDAQASPGNIYFNMLIYAIFIAIHIVMTMPAFKRAIYKKPEATPYERRIYVTITIVTWLAVYYLHRPVPGFGFTSPFWMQVLGLCFVLLSVVAFFEFATFEALSSLLGVPGSPLSHSAGTKTPLLSEGPYASVRHPMYRAMTALSFSSLLIHPNSGQLLFAVMVTASFLCFIPFEEHQLIKARGDEYREYIKRTPYRVFRGIW